MTAALRRLWWIFAIFAIVAIILLMFYPKPSAEGSCYPQCSTKQVGVIDVYDLDAQAVCGTGCLIEGIDVGVQHPFLVTCKCCDCIGDTDLALPSCGNSQLGFIYKWLGACV